MAERGKDLITHRGTRKRQGSEKWRACNARMESAQFPRCLDGRQQHRTLSTSHSAHTRLATVKMLTQSFKKAATKTLFVFTYTFCRYLLSLFVDVGVDVVEQSRPTVGTICRLRGDRRQPGQFPFINRTQPGPEEYQPLWSLLYRALSRDVA